MQNATINLTFRHPSNLCPLQAEHLRGLDKLNKLFVTARESDISLDICEHVRHLKSLDISCNWPTTQSNLEGFDELEHLEIYAYRQLIDDGLGKADVSFRNIN